MTDYTDPGDAPSVLATLRFLHRFAVRRPTDHGAGSLPDFIRVCPEGVANGFLRWESESLAAPLWQEEWTKQVLSYWSYCATNCGDCFVMAACAAHGSGADLLDALILLSEDALCERFGPDQLPRVAPRAWASARQIKRDAMTFVFFYHFWGRLRGDDDYELKYWFTAAAHLISEVSPQLLFNSADLLDLSPFLEPPRQDSAGKSYRRCRLGFAKFARSPESVLMAGEGSAD